MKNKKEIFRAWSKEDGIVFRSNKIPALCYEAFINQSGEIETRTMLTIISEISNSGVENSIDTKKRRKVEAYCKIVIYVIAILSIFISKSPSIAVGLMYFSAIALKDLIEFSMLSFSLKLGKYKSTARFHAAEHKALNAYVRKQRIPSITEVRKAPRFDKLCGSRKNIDKIVIFGLMLVVISLSPFIEFYQYFILIILFSIFSFIQTKYNILRFLQIFVTNTPTDKELEVAIAGIELFEKMEEEITEDYCPMGSIFMKINIQIDDEEESAED